MKGAQAMAVTAVVLAAGIGKRMKSDLPKVLHEAAGLPLVSHVVRALGPLGCERIVFVVGRGQEEAVSDAVRRSQVEGDHLFVVQDPPRGTGDAVRIALDHGGVSSDSVLVVPGDAPLLESSALANLLRSRTDGVAASMLTTVASDPTGYGRVIRDGGGAVAAIVEERDATPEQKDLNEVNASVYAFSTRALREVIGEIGSANAQGEHYLTDAISLLRERDQRVEAVRADDLLEAGVNSRAQLAQAAKVLRRRAAEALMDEGVTIVDPETTYIDSTVEVGRDAVIHPFTFLEGNTVIGPRAEVGPHARILDSIIEEDAAVTHAVVRGSSIGPEASVGPFASLRPGTRLGRGAHLGTFVETKNAQIGEGSKANHLAYLGDAEIGRGVNVGAGTITCNWDGTSKHKTIIEDEAYIGSDTMLVAPTRIGKRAATGAGAVVRGEVPDEALAVGVPARVIEGKGNKMNRERDGKA